MESLTPRPLSYEAKQTVITRVEAYFQPQSRPEKEAFLTNIVNMAEPSHISAYRLCALAESFPHQFLRGDQVIESSEVTLSHNTEGRSYTAEAMDLRDILLWYVKANQSRLIRRAAIKLGLL